MDSWKTILSFGDGQFSVAMLVLGRVCSLNWNGCKAFSKGWRLQSLSENIFGCPVEDIFCKTSPIHYCSMGLEYLPMCISVYHKI